VRPSDAVAAPPPTASSLATEVNPNRYRDIIIGVVLVLAVIVLLIVGSLAH